MEKPKLRVLVYRLGSLGDTIIALPVFNKIKEAYPQAEIILLTNKPVVNKAAPLEAILGNQYYFDKLINYSIGTRDPKVLWALWRQIRALEVDVFINLTASRFSKTERGVYLAVLRDKIFFKSIGIKKVIGFPKLREDYFVTVDAATGEYEWEAKRLARRMVGLGSIALNEDRYWDMHLTTDEVAAGMDAIAELDGSPVLSICAGTKMQSKDWGEENWINLMQQLGKLLKSWKLVILGAPDEEERAQKCLQAWGNGGLNLCGKTSPRVSAVILRHAKVFIGHDSGPMHLAACVGTPCIAIFSARNLPRQWYPRGDNNIILYHKTDCAGCNLETCVVEKKKCIESITIAEVQDAVTKLITNVGL